MGTNYNSDKFTALVHYICRTCRDPFKLGKTKLHKILWLADIYAYKHYGAPITGESYKKYQFGPCSTHLNSVLKLLESENRMFIKESEWGDDGKRYEFFAKGDVRSSLFTEKELQIINDAREYVCENHTAESISDHTHDAIWEMALMGEIIPYEAMLVASLAKVTDKDIEWAKSELGKIRI